MKAFFVRHGQTNYNLKDLCNDDPKKDVHLTELGKRQAEEVAEKLRNEKIGVIFISELPRTRETAEIINRFHGAPIKVDKRLNDRKTGFEGRPVSEFDDAVKKDALNTKPRGGESFMEEKKRVVSFIKSLKRMKYKGVVVITHSEPLKIINAYFGGLSDTETPDLHVGNCEIAERDV